MQRILLVALAGLLGASPSVPRAESLEQAFVLDGDETRASRYERSTTGRLIVDVDGSASNVEIDLPPREREIYRSLFSRVRFDPVLRDGRPVRAETGFVIHLYAEKIPDSPQMRFGVEDITFVAPSADGHDEVPSSELRPHTYPLAMEQENTGAMVMLLLRLDEAGRVIDAAAKDVDLYAHRLSSPRVAGGKAERFVRRSVEAAQDWIIRDPQAIERGSVFVPVVFSPPGTGRSTWQPVFEMRASQLPWMQAAMSEAIAFTAGGQPSAPEFRLIAPIGETAIQ